MRVIITLDRYDGSSSQIKVANLEDLNLRELAFAMTEAQVCGFTVTKDRPLVRAVASMAKDSPQ